MKLSFPLNGSTFDCNIGYSLLTNAATHIKEKRHADFRLAIDAVAAAGANDATKESILAILQEHVRNQVPTDQEVRTWLLTLDGQKFSLIHGTRNFPTKLTPETADMALDEMSEAEATLLLDAIGNLCYGAEMSRINRETSQEMIKMARLELESLKEEVNKAAETTTSVDPGEDKTNLPA